jgi:hypothetical protein
MKKIHVAAVAVMLGIAAVFGTIAATRTAGLGASSRQDAIVQTRTKQLNAFERSLHRQLTQAASTAAPAGAAAAPRIVYHRPPPIVVVKHSSHGDDGVENASGEGGGGDD